MKRLTQEALQSAFDKLTAEVIGKEDELRRRENSAGTSHDVRKMTRLRDEIASLNKRIDRVLSLLEAGLLND